MIKLTLGIVIVSAIATLGDYIWYEIGVRHRMIAGVIHGAALLMSVGGVLGWTARRVGIGLQVGIGAGIVGALAYYALAPAMGYPAMFVAWVVVWMLLAYGEGRILGRPARPWLTVLTRGVIAAALSGIAFYAISGTVWGRAPAGGRSYVQHFFAWIVAWAPGILAIGLPGRTSRSINERR
jgi:hypothetical protein